MINEDLGYGAYLYSRTDALLAAHLLNNGIPGYHVESILFKINDDGLFSARIRANFYERLRKNEWEICLCRQDNGDFWVVLSIWRRLSPIKRIERTVENYNSTLRTYRLLIRAFISVVDEAERVL